MSRATSLILGEYFDQLIEAQVKSGRYETASEVVRDALRLFEQKQTAIQRLSDAVDQGFASGLMTKLIGTVLRNVQRPQSVISEIKY